MQKLTNIINILNLIVKREENKTGLGRWIINYCPNLTNKKIDLANHDNCGPCGPKDLKEYNNIFIKKNKNTKDLE